MILKKLSDLLKLRMFNFQRPGNSQIFAFHETIYLINNLHFPSPEIFSKLTSKLYILQNVVLTEPIKTLYLMKFRDQNF